MSSGYDRTVRFWDVSTGKLKRSVKLQGPAGLGCYPALSPNGKFVACSDGGKLILWDVESGKELKRLPGPPPTYPPRLLFSPDGETLAVTCDDYKMSLWKWTEGKERHLDLPITGRGAGRDMSCHARFSPDGKLLVTGPSRQDPLCIWDLATGQEIRRLDAAAYSSALHAGRQNPRCGELPGQRQRTEERSAFLPR
jgi:WD40 repeat protein